jgi:hypothetical protein
MDEFVLDSLIYGGFLDNYKLMSYKKTLYHARYYVFELTNNFI